MKATRIKFCGITRTEDALAAAALGVDALGFVLTRRSRRHVDAGKAADIAAALPPFVTTVALFMDDDAVMIDAALARFRPDLLQFHGSESQADCARHGLRWLKAVPMASVVDVASYAAGYPGASGFLLDANAVGEPGGGGHRFDWSMRPVLHRALIVAGGLDADNVTEAIRALRPQAVDVSSGIESAPGIKDPLRMQRFVAAVRSAIPTDHDTTQ